MPRGIELPPALRALAETGWALARRAPTARVGLARAADLVDPDALPESIREPVVDELQRARLAACEPLDQATVERVLNDAWGRAPRKVLDELGAEPLAIRAAAQTHRGVLDGTAVAIRVQRPGLERALRADLALLDTLAAPLGAALPAADTRALLRAVREQTLDELDFEHEASTHRRVARALRGIRGLVLPRVHGELCGAQVFVADLLEGTTLADGGRPADAGAAARTLVDAHVAAARAGLALLDARPGHVVVLADGGIGLLGAGLARPVSRERVGRALAALQALRDEDHAAFAEAAGELLPAEAARTAFDLARSALGPVATGPATLDAEALRSAAHVAPAAAPLLLEARAHPDDLRLGRAAAQLVATLARLGAHEDWPALVASSARR